MKGSSRQAPVAEVAARLVAQQAATDARLAEVARLAKAHHEELIQEIRALHDSWRVATWKIAISVASAIATAATAVVAWVRHHGA